jgi:hypothetical protein
MRGTAANARQVNQVIVGKEVVVDSYSFQAEHIRPCLRELFDHRRAWRHEGFGGYGFGQIANWFQTHYYAAKNL